MPVTVSCETQPAMPFPGPKTKPTEVKNRDRFWLRDDGTAFSVDDHLKAAQFAKAALADDARPFPWGYDDIFRRGCAVCLSILK